MSGLNSSANGKPALRVCVAHVGARRYYALPRVLAARGMLEYFFTDSYLGNKRVLRRLIDTLPASLTPSLLKRYSGRVAIDVPSQKVVSFDGLRLRVGMSGRRATSSKAAALANIATVKAFNARILRHGLGEANVFWTLVNSGLEVFQGIQEARVVKVLDQNQMPRKTVQTVYRMEMERWPDWQVGRESLDVDPMEERQCAEWEMADRVVVPSEFVLRALQESGVEKEKLRVISYPVDLDRFRPEFREPSRTSKGLVVLFVGEVGIRKGVPDLLEGLRLLSSRQVRARIVGPIALSADKLKKFSLYAEFIGPVPRSEIYKELQRADMVVFPSLCEGSALVVGEALACGVPVITTEESGSLVRHGVDGQVVESRNPAAIAAAIDAYASDRELLSEHGANAINGRSRLGIGAYGEKVVAVAREAVMARSMLTVHQTSWFVDH